jgi:predicted HicB family RNase H-like nuclease
MEINIELPPEIEASLTARAAAEDISVREYVG